MRFKLVLVGAALAGLALPGAAPAQAPQSSIWIAPYLGLGIQSAYYDGIVVFSDGGTDFLRIDPGVGVVFGGQFGYRFRPAWTLQVNVATSSPDAEYVEDLTLRPDVKLRTTQLEVGVLYDVGTFPIGGKVAPFSLGGGLSLTFHSLNRFTWSGEFVKPSTTSVGVHGVAALDIPLAPKVSFRGQGKLTLSPLGVGGLEDKIGAAESVGEPMPITASLDGGTATYFVLAAGLLVRL